VLPQDDGAAPSATDTELSTSPQEIVVLQRLAHFSYRKRRLVLLLWIVALIGIAALGSSVGGSYSQSFSLPGTESQKANDLLQARFPAKAGDSGRIVFSDPAGVRNPAVQSRMSQVFADVARVPGVTGVESPYLLAGARQVAKAGTVAYATVDFAKRDADIATRTLDSVRNVAQAARGKGLQIELGGRMFQSGPGLGATELIGVVAAIIILLLVFGSVLAMGLPILIALFGIGIGLGFVELISHIVSTPDFATQLASMIGIGVGIDYALFIVTRYREGLHEGLDPESAVVRAIDTAGRAVVFAGTTVMISVLGLYLMGVAFVQGLAVGTSITVALVMLGSITLLPAVLGFAGHSIDRLSVPGRRTRAARTRQSFWFRWSRIVQRRPWPAFLATLAVLGVLAVPMFSLRLGFSDAGGNPTSDTTRRAYDVLAQGFGPGSNGPLTLAAEYPAGTNPAVLNDLATTLRQTSGIARVAAPTMSPSGTASVIEVIPTSSPQAPETTTLVNHLRDQVIPQAVRGTPVVVHVGGVTAAGTDVSSRLSGRLPLFIGAVLALSFLLLMAVFRSVLVPLKAVIMNLLSIGAAYGLIVAVFQWGWLGSIVGVAKTGPIAPFIPMMIFAITFGLSMDYEVFLLSRIREFYDRTHDNGLAVADGLAATARVITAAALIMVTVFLSFVLGTNTTIKLFGLGLAAAIFIDATLVRMVLVPATMELLGDRNWWFPRWLDRIVPRLHVEPSGPEPLPEETERPGVPVTAGTA
jgi:putative drug exporter of the RND superfamily